MSTVSQRSGANMPLIPGLNFSSTYEAPTAEELADRFQELLRGGRPFIYQRFGTPLIEMVEQALLEFEARSVESLLFRSGMAAISTAIQALVDPRLHPVIIHSEPLYGCTFEYLTTIAPKFGYEAVSLKTATFDEPFAKYGGRVGAFFVEHPSNPVISLFDLDAIFQLREQYFTVHGYRPPIIVDSTFMSPLFCHPHEHGADVVIHSVTKYLGGHSDILGGVVFTKEEALMAEIRRYRNVLGNLMDEMSSWLLLRSLETLELRVCAQASSALEVARFLADHPAVEKVLYPGLLTPGGDLGQHMIFQRTCDSPGSMISIYLKNPTRGAAFRVINATKVFRRAVSLGGTHSLIEHPASTTHAGVPEEVRIQSGITENLIRLSVGVEITSKLIMDLRQALLDLAA
ncbi:MAG: PLP-dependent aspartate aminotransferase family protein [Patescibacteria group bacterium]|jgi:methionine-gamma-lyase